MQLLFKPYTFHAAGIRSNSAAGTPHRGGIILCCTSFATLLFIFSGTLLHNMLYWLYAF